jgi:hypothetical protein
MGESKWRKANDPNYGQAPKRKAQSSSENTQPQGAAPAMDFRGRLGLPQTDPVLVDNLENVIPDGITKGLVVSAPVEISGSSITIKRPSLDPQELRLSLLLWDHLVWPSNSALQIGGGPDEAFLKNAKVLTRPKYNFNGDAAQGSSKTQVKAFVDLDRSQPGVWALAQGPNSLLIKDGFLEEGGGALIELHRAIPVPDRGVPLNEILEFRLKRRDELLLLRAEIEGLLVGLEEVDNVQAELQRRISKVDEACATALRLEKEWQFPIHIADLKNSFEFRPAVTALAGAGAFTAATQQGLPVTTAALAGLAAATAATAPAWKVVPDFKWRGLRPRSGPYRYVYSFHRELF